MEKTLFLKYCFSFTRRTKPTLKDLAPILSCKLINWKERATVLVFYPWMDEADGPEHTEVSFLSVLRSAIFCDSDLSNRSSLLRGIYVFSVSKNQVMLDGVGDILRIHSRATLVLNTFKHKQPRARESWQIFTAQALCSTLQKGVKWN
jgi:hypothetical protein